VSSILESDTQIHGSTFDEQQTAFGTNSEINKVQDAHKKTS